MPVEKSTKKKRDTHKNDTKRTKKAVKENSIELTDPTKKGLTPSEQSFCEIYISPTEFYGNGTQSYIEAYKVEIVAQGGGTRKKLAEGKNKQMTLGSVREAAYRLLTRVDILERIDSLMEEGGLNDQFVDKQLKHLITQQADPRVQLAALAEYNKLKARIVNQQSNIHTFATDDMSDEELMRVIEEKRKFYKKE